MAREHMEADRAWVGNVAAGGIAARGVEASPSHF